ncbi:MAG: leucyl aminopeptidase [Acidobacteriota bacterium]
MSASRGGLSEIDADLLAVPVGLDHRPNLGWLDQATDGEFSRAIERSEFTGKAAQIWTAPLADRGWRTRRVIAVGSGPLHEFGARVARRVGLTIGLTARQQMRARVAVAVPEAWPSTAVEALVEGVGLANYDAGHRKSKADDLVFLSSVELNGLEPALVAAIDHGSRMAEAVNAARHLIDEPANHLSPRELVARAQALLALPDVTTDILDEGRLEALGMGLLLGVGRGSAEPPRMLVARYAPPDAPPTPVLGLVGKGITFDTGGISIKPADGMERMKDDMAGGATVVAALRVIAVERLPIHVVAIVPAAENMPGGRALKPGDVLQSAAGITVEVNNTDAEGRLILGDALWYAKRLGATHLVDVATLTGACVVALGKSTTGLFATGGWSEVIQAAAERAGERVWPLPLFDEYREALKSEVADLLNSPGRPAGAVTAAKFLQEFVGDTPWAHLDIAGTAWADDAKPWVAKGATGVMIRTLVELARTAGAAWPERRGS